jgi:translocation and assembly module TamA
MSRILGSGALTGALVLGLMPQALADVVIEGLPDELMANALAHLTLDDEPCDSPEWRVRRLLNQGVRELRVAAETVGYYEPSIETDLLRNGDCWQATFLVSLGKPTLVRAFQVKLLGAAERDPGFVSILANTSLRSGSVFRHYAYEDLKRSLLEHASRTGYADAELTSNVVDIYPQEQAADVTMVVDAGERYAFGEVRYQQAVLKPGLIERYLPFRRGDPYDSRRLSDFYGVLAGSGYFDQIQVEPLLAERADGEIPVSVVLTPADRKVYTAGAGFSTNTGPRGRLGYTNRRIDERGHQWGANLLLSNVVSELTSNYRLPLGDPRSEWLSLDIGFKHEATDTSTSDAYQMGVRRIKERAGGWRESQFLDLLIEDFVIGDQRDSSTLVIPGIAWLRVKTENRFRPDRGSRLFLELRGSADALGSDTNFFRAEAAAKWIRRLGRRSRVILRGELGATLTDGFSELPPSVRFFAGGDASIRGYDFQSLGPVGPDGNVIGGTGKLIASAEYEIDVKQKWSLATFVDSGNAFENFDLAPQTGAGLGVRWQSPVGPIRVDVAKPFNGPDRGLRLHITFGPDL